VNVREDGNAKLPLDSPQDLKTALEAGPAIRIERAIAVTALATVGFPFDDEREHGNPGRKERGIRG